MDHSSTAPSAPPHLCRSALLCITLVTLPGLAASQVDDPPSDGTTVEEEIVVLGTTAGDLGLAAETSTGSRLGLTLMETPAAVDRINSETMQARGHHSVAEAVQTLPGIVSGESPAAPSTFSLRGFTRGQVTFLRDSIWVGPTGMVMRPQNTFTLDRIELLRGAAGAMHGQGSVAGVINAIPKRAERRDRQPIDLSLSYGRFGTSEVGVGTGGPMSARSWYRIDAVNAQSDGYVERMDSRSTNLTGSVLFGLSDSLDLRFSADYLDDQLANYWGTPLTPRSFTGANEARGIISTQNGDTLDRRILRTNYNVHDGIADSDQLFVRGNVLWQGSRIGLESNFYDFSADREWANAEGFIFNPATEMIDRTNGFFFITHDQEMRGNRTLVSHQGQLGGHDNRLVVGLEASDLDFTRSRGFRFSEQPGDSVSLLRPSVGNYGPRELRGTSPTDLQILALFVEEHVQLTDSFSLLASARGEWLDLDRKNFGRTGELEADSSFARDFNNVNWKLGAVYEASSSLSVFGQLSSTTDPVNSDLFLVNADEDFDLTEGEQWEVGLKGLWLQGRAEGTLTYFDLSRDDVLEQIGVDTVANVGGRDASGIELATAFSPIWRVRIGLNASYTDAEYRPSPNFVRNAGNRPPNVPEIVANLFAQVTDIGGIPLDLGVDLRHVGDRFGDSANTVTLESYDLLGAFIGYRRGVTRFTLRVHNLTDELYSPWADVYYLQQTDPEFPYANQVLIGAPRTYELSVRTRF